MIRSMTGYGRGEQSTERYVLRVEARSVNNRSLRVVFRLPERLQGMEQDLEKVTRESISRGSVTITANLDDISGDPGYILDVNALRYYRNTLAQFQELGEHVPASTLMQMPGVVRKKLADELGEDVVECMNKALADALAGLVATREAEGANLWADILSHCQVVEDLVAKLEACLPNMLEMYRQRLSERLGKLMEGLGSTITVEEIRRELALFADRSDISEEIARMRSHLQLVRDGDKSREAFGRKLEFITQEMFREANTMGSKSNDPQMVHYVLDIKAEVEKLREQALNVE